MADTAEKQGEVLAVGELTEDKTWQILKSAKSAVTNGEHFILNVLQQGKPLSHREIKHQKKRKAISILMLFAQKRKPDGKWIITLNGPGLITRPTFHVHAICPGNGDRVLRTVFNADDFCKRLRGLLDIQNMVNLKTELQSLILEFEDNLK